MLRVGGLFGVLEICLEMDKVDTEEEPDLNSGWKVDVIQDDGSFERFQERYRIFETFSVVDIYFCFGTLRLVSTEKFTVLGSYFLFS